MALAFAAPQYSQPAPSPVSRSAPIPAPVYKPAPSPAPVYKPAPAPTPSYVSAPAPAYGAAPVYPDVPPAYDFAYAVSDLYHGVDFGANENRNGWEYFSANLLN